jgi:hypothetical protein
MTEHPGEITWVDGTTGEVTRVDSADNLPDTIRFATDENGTLVPVVRIEVTGTDNHREIAQIAEDGRVLRRTYQSRS